jgi:plastocyanin
MERRWITKAAAALGTLELALVLVACTDDSNGENASGANIVNPAPTETTATEAAQRFEIDIANFQFGPADAVVAAGTEVVWVNNDTDVHSVVSTGDLFANSDVFAPGESYSVVFTEPGTYAYSCGVHPFMMGTVTVEA